MLQTIQRELEIVEVKQKELEERGVQLEILFRDNNGNLCNSNLINTTQLFAQLFVIGGLNYPIMFYFRRSTPHGRVVQVGAGKELIAYLRERADDIVSVTGFSACLLQGSAEGFMLNLDVFGLS